MHITHRIEWNGEQNIIVIENGDHGRIEMTLDEFFALADQLKADLHSDPIDGE
ncbi:hypothetical protein [Mesorhizobium sp.]|uniref:hypothetical protein n=1 Tax=Mesorhizobium sp. TaxID=1871066 RepID=UPI0025F12336|nr:hypothetical protein [Mesorhizobium sp.]